MKRPAWWKPRRQRSRVEWFAWFALRWTLIFYGLRVALVLATGHGITMLPSWSNP